MVLFYDGSNEGPCRRPRVHAFTAPGSRRRAGVPVAGEARGRRARATAEALVIHEVLHTLGLEENPPSSEEITVAVERRCRP